MDIMIEEGMAFGQDIEAVVSRTVQYTPGTQVRFIFDTQRYVHVHQRGRKPSERSTRHSASNCLSKYPSALNLSKRVCSTPRQTFLHPILITTTPIPSSFENTGMFPCSKQQQPPPQPPSLFHSPSATAEPVLEPQAWLSQLARWFIKCE